MAEGSIRPQSIGPFDRRPLRWSRDGRDLFFWDRDRLMSVAIRPGPAIDSGAPRVVFEMSGVVHFDVAPDGKQFLVTRQIPTKRLTRIVIALGGAFEIGNGAP